MKVISINTYLDGGTQEILTTDGTFWKDGRLSSTTRGQFYFRGFPGTEKSTLMDDPNYEMQLRVAIESFNNKAVNDYSIKLDPRTEARNLITKFSETGNLTLSQAKKAAETHIQIILDSKLVDSQRMINFWNSVKFELRNKLTMFTENPEIDHVN